MNKKLTVIIIGLVVLILATGIYCLKFLNKHEQGAINNQNGNTILSSIPSEWKTFSDSSLGISFRYPNDWNDISFKIEKNDFSNLPGTIIFSEGGNDNVYFFASSKDYKNYDFPEFNKQVNINWSTDEFNTNIGYPKALLFKKLNDKAALLFSYIAPECSPMASLSIVIPLNDNYPNLRVTIKYPFDEDPIIEAYKQTQEFKQSDGCDLTKPYEEIANKISNGTYSEELNKNINIVSLIAESLTINK